MKLRIQKENGEWATVNNVSAVYCEAPCLRLADRSPPHPFDGDGKQSQWCISDPNQPCKKPGPEIG